MTVRDPNLLRAFVVLTISDSKGEGVAFSLVTAATSMLTGRWMRNIPLLSALQDTRVPGT